MFESFYKLHDVNYVNAFYGIFFDVIITQFSHLFLGII